MPEEQPNPYEATGSDSPTAEATHPARAFLLLNVVLISFIAGLFVIALMMPTFTTSSSTPLDAQGNLVATETTITTNVNLSLMGLVTTAILVGVANALMFFYFWVARWVRKRV